MASPVAGLKVLDLVFAMDCTGSMGSYIQQAQDSIKAIADEIVRQEKADLQMALIEYRDHPPQDSSYVTNVLDFTWSLRDLKARLDACTASGGGDTPEAVADALHALLKLSWRPESTKVCVFIADAPPHALGCDNDGFATGCPCGLDPMVTVREIAEKDIMIYMVGCEPSINAYRDWFMSVAYITGGQYVPLSAAKLLPQVIIGGTQEEMSLQHLLQDASAEVVKLSSADDGSVKQEDVEKLVYDKLRSTGVKTKHLKASAGVMPQISDKAKQLSEKMSMTEVRQVFQPGTYDAATDRLAAAALPADYHYLTVEEDISYAQASRLVQRSLNTRNLASKISKRD